MSQAELISAGSASGLTYVNLPSPRACVGVRAAVTHVMLLARADPGRPASKA